MRATLLLLAAMLAAYASTGGGAAAAQGTCGTRDQGSFSVTLSPAAVVFPQPKVSHYLAGLITLTAPLVITVDPNSGVGNNTWYVCVRTTASNLGEGKSIGDLQFYNSETGSWLPLSGGFKTIATRSGNSVKTITVPMRVLLRWEDSPGTYGPTVLVFRFSR